MSDTLFKRVQLGDIAERSANSFVDGPFGSSLKSDEYTGEGVRLIQLQNIGINQWLDGNQKFISDRKFQALNRHGAIPGDIAIAKMAEPVARACIVPPVSEQFVVVADCIRLRPDTARFVPSYVVRAINSPYTRMEAEKKATGSTRVRINLTTLKSVGCLVPSYEHQSKIAEILDTLDSAIRGTEAVVAKLKAMKQGLLHDLLTRGIDANGDLRPPQFEAPHLYQQTPLGLLPKEWGISVMGDVAESIIDGPFGSNLKTAHYVETPGVRVVRLQNIQDGYFDNTEKAFIRERHATQLSRHEVMAGDLLIASLGDDGHPVGRACLYPDDLDPGINKADCFRFRGKSFCRNGYAMLFLNGTSGRRQARGFEQGMTMKRMNLGNLRKVRISLPPSDEQERMEIRAAAIDLAHDNASIELEKLRLQKSGLMDDLLTGRKSVAALL